MRNLIVAAALAAAAGPAAAQGSVKVDTKQRMATQDTLVRILRTQLSAEQVRHLWLEVNALMAANVKNNDLWQKESHSNSPDAQKRMAALKDEMGRIGFLLLPKQSDFVMACAMMRRNDFELPGTLGLQLDDSVHWVFDQRLGTLTVVVSSPRKIAGVASGSPAEKSGLQVGDVLMSINGRPFMDSVRFDEMLSPGSPVTARVQRAGRELGVTMTVVKRESDYPSECNYAKQFDFPTPFFKSGRGGVIALSPMKPGERVALPMPSNGPNIQMFTYTTSKILYGGAVLQPLDDDWREMSGLQGEGLLVTELPEGSPAEVAGFRKFDLIKLVNNEPVATAVAFQKIMRAEPKLVFTVFNKKLGTTRQVMMIRRP